MIQKTPISLKSFFIYNSTFGPKEGEEEKKILFYYPLADDLDTRIKNVGLCEAIVKFTNTFTNDDSCQHMRTQKTTQFYYQPEKDYWMIMTLNVPAEKKENDGIECNEYKSGDLHVGIFREVLKQSYNMFRLFLGTFPMNLGTFGNDDQDRIHLTDKLQLFFSKYLLTLKLQNCDIINACRSIQYMPLNQLLFLRVHNFIEMIEATFPMVKHCIFIYNEQVVWSEINSIDLYSIYEYLAGTIFPKTVQHELRGGSITRSYSLDSPHYGSFVTGPESFENSIRVPKIYLFGGGGGDGDYKIFNLVIYRALSATICLLIEDGDELSEETYFELHSFIGPQLTNIASDIGENFLNEPSITNNGHHQVPAPQFLFLNELSFKHTGTVHGNDKVGQNKIPADVMNLLADLHADDVAGTPCSKETVLKTHNDYWIVKKSNNWRHFYVIVNKSSTLLEITEDAKRLFDEHTKHMFF